MTILVKRKTRPPLIINTEQELTIELKKVSKNFRQINDLNRHLFKQLHLAPISSPSIFYDMLKVLLGCKGTGTKVNKEKLVANYGWTVVDAEEWDYLFRTRIDRYLEKTGKDKKSFFRQNSKFAVDFWIKQGFTHEEAIKNVSALQSAMSSRLTKEQHLKNSCLSTHFSGYDGLTKEEKKEKIAVLQKRRSPRTIEYWENQGFNAEEAALLRSMYQASRMDNKTEEERMAINKKKGKSIINFRTLWTSRFDCPGILYIIEIAPELFKIGITSRPKIEGRGGRYTKKDLADTTIRLDHKMPSLTDAFCIEQIVLRILKNSRQVDDHKQFGQNEVINLPLTKILDEVNSRINKSAAQLKEELFSLINTAK